MTYTPDEVIGICNFLKQTPEGNLRKMLVDTNLTETHFRILMKLAKGGPESDFVEAFQNDTMGKLRLGAKEIPIKEAFWSICKKKLIQLGLLTNKPVAA